MRTALLLPLALFGLPLLAEHRYSFDHEEITGTAVGDPSFEDKGAVEVWLDREAEVSVKAIPAGNYEVKIEGRYIGKRNVRYSMNMQVTLAGKPAKEQSIWCNSMPFDGKYHEIKRRFRANHRTALKLSFSFEDHALEEEAKALAEQKLANIAKPTVDNALDETEDIEAELADLPRPAGTDSFLLRRVEIVRLPEPVVIEKIWSDKIHYCPGEKAGIDVVLRNVSAANADGLLTLELVRGLDEVKPLLKEQLTIEAGKTLTRNVELTTDQEYGYEIRAVIADGQTGWRHQMSEYFSVSENLFEVALQGWGRVGVMNDQETMRNLLNMPEEKLQGLARAGALGNRRNYFNMIEYFSWAPDDFFNLSPKKDVWWSGTMTYLKIKRDMLTDIRELQSHGIKVLSYAQPFAIGIDTVKELRVNPGFFTYYGNGAPGVSYDYDLIKSRARVDMGLRPAELGGGLNFYSLKTVDRGIDALIASWKMFGWNGVRFDNRYYRANNPITYTGKRATQEKDLDKYSARNMQHMKARFKKEIGDRWLISHNNGYRFHHEGNELGWRETVKGGLMCMDEETEGSVYPASALNPWTRYISFATEARRFCTKLGGYYQLFPPGRAQVPSVDMLYYVVSCLLSGSHPLSSDPEHSPAGTYGRFFTRFSAMLFARDIKPLPEAESFLSIEGKDAERIWWKDFANTRDLAGKRWFLFPLAVRPAAPKIAQNAGSVIPPLASGLKVKLTKAKMPTAPRAFVLSGEWQQMAVPLKLNESAAALEASLPAFNHFALLVIEGGRK